MNIITALKNPNLNNKLKEKTNFNIIGNDIQYQEGILEMLQKNEEINLIIISELLPGEMNFKGLISKIKNINKKIEIIVFLSNENEELKNYLISKGIFNIFINNQITIEELIKIINEKNISKKEIEINEEIKELKKIILEKENKKIKINIFNNIKLKKILNLIKNKFNKKNINNNKKIISVVGPFGVGKSSFCTLLAKNIKNKKILIIDFDILNSSINSIFNVKIYPKKIKEKNTTNINNLIIKYSRNINLLCATKILVDKDYKKIKDDFINKLNDLKNKYDLIIIDNSSECFFEYTKQIFKISDLILFLTEPNLTELKKSKNLLNIYINNWNIKKEKINIIFNKTNKNSIYDKILNTLFSDFNILGKIKINIDYNLIINRNIKFINKKIKKDYLKIIEKLKI
ncbi:MAG: hypothetical protein J5507_00740 [Clostridia bacterium]|nr:hypothetical protein [Clostridia bacterium]